MSKYRTSNPSRFRTNFGFYENETSPIPPPTPPPPEFYNDAIAMWEFGANSGAIGADYKGVHNASASVGITKTSSNQPLGEQTATLSVSANNPYYSRIPYNANLSHQGRSFSYYLLFRPSSNLASSYNNINLFAKDMYQVSKRTFIVGADGTPNNNDYEIYALIGNGGSGNTFIQSFLTSGQLNNWHLIGIEYIYDATLSSTRLSMYIDNIRVVHITPTIFISDDSAYDYALIGRFNTTSIPGSADYLNGSNQHQIGYVYRWNRVLSQDERDYLWNSGNFRYLRP